MQLLFLVSFSEQVKTSNIFRSQSMKSERVTFNLQLASYSFLIIIKCTHEILILVVISGFF